MEKLLTKLAEIEDRVRTLLEDRDQLLQEKADLQRQNHILQDKISRQEVVLEEMEKEMLAIRKQTQTSSGQDKPDERFKHLKKHIDKYTKEIDKAIEWLYNN
ncbi:MAG: hypothetical protein AAFV80_00270 [Bacteroidota bacterium]